MTIREQPTEVLLEWLRVMREQANSSMSRQVAHAHKIKMAAVEIALKERGVLTFPCG